MLQVQFSSHPQVIHPFTPSKSAELALSPGEKIKILKQTELWFYGQSDTSNLSGIFPKSHVVLLPSLDTISPLAVVAEITGIDQAHLSEALKECKDGIRSKFQQGESLPHSFMKKQLKILAYLKKELMHPAAQQEELRKSAAHVSSVLAEIRFVEKYSR